MKKIVALISGIALMLSLTVSCAADDAWKNNTGTINLSDFSVTGDGIAVEDTTVKITKGGDFEVIGKCDDGMIYVNTEERVKLRLSGMSLTNNDGPAIFFDNVDKGFITITENTENFIADGKEYATEDADAALFSNDDLEIKGAGTLEVTGNYKHGIASDDDLNIENGKISINSYEHGIKVNDTLHITGGDITVVAETGKGMKAELEFIIDDGNLNITSKADEGLESKGIMTINGGNIEIYAKDDGINTGNTSTTETTESTIPQMPEGEMPQGGFGGGRGQRQETERTEGQMPQGSFGGRGQRTDMEQFPEGMTPPEMPEGAASPKMPGGTASSEIPEGTTSAQRPQGDNFRGGMGGGFDMVDEETAAAHAVTINGGKIYIETECDGIDSNGNLTINGGEIVIDGPTNNGNGSLDCQGTMQITGGTVFTASSNGMMQLPRESDVCILRINVNETKPAGTKVEIKATDSDIIVYSHTPSVKFQLITFTSSDLVEGTEYTVYFDGKAEQSFTASKNSFGGMGGGVRPQANKPQNDISVSVDGNEVVFDSKPYIKNDSTLVGFRGILEALGATVVWNGENRTVTAVKDGVEIVLEIDSTTASVNGKLCALPVAPEIVNDRTMIPVRFISENLNMNVVWNENTRHIAVTSK